MDSFFGIFMDKSLKANKKPPQHRGFTEEADIVPHSSSTRIAGFVPESKRRDQVSIQAPKVSDKRSGRSQYFFQWTEPARDVKAELWVQGALERMTVNLRKGPGGSTWEIVADIPMGSGTTFLYKYLVDGKDAVDHSRRQDHRLKCNIAMTLQEGSYGMATPRSDAIYLDRSIRDQSSDMASSSKTPKQGFSSINTVGVPSGTPADEKHIDDAMAALKREQLEDSLTKTGATPISDVAQSSPAAPNPTPRQQDKKNKYFTYSDVTKHSTKHDLFMVIHDKVYDVTRFVSEHPGGEEVLLEAPRQHANYATEAFEEVGHSDEAIEILESLQIGSLTYDYKKLDFDTHEIRILVMEAISDETSRGDLKCQIQHESLISPTPYSALSYCWGPVEPRKEVILDGLKQGITPNLYDALQEVRRHHYRSKRHDPIRLWVDALCINQNDNQERSEQVRTMRQIYSMAEEVFAYVGDNKTDPDEIAAFSHFIKKSQQGILLDRTPQLDGYLNKLFCQPYWRRAWVIQELTVSYNVTISFGSCYVSWADLSIVLGLFNQPETDAVGDGFRGLTHSDAEHLLRFRTDFLLERKPIPLLDALVWSRRTLATDPRDKIFALLGLCHDGATFVPVPNYKQSLQTVIVEMSRSMMMLDRSLDLMVFKGNRALSSDDKMLPSWVPNWPSLWAGGMTCQERSFEKWRNRYNFNPIAGKIQPGNMLKLTGAFLGTIRSMTTKMGSNENGSTTKSPVRSWIYLFEDVKAKGDRAADINEVYSEKREALSGLWKTLTMDTLHQLSGKTFVDGASFAFACSQLWTPHGRGIITNIDLIQWIDHNVNFLIEGVTLREWSQIHWLLPQPRGLESERRKALDLFLEALEKVLSSGTRLACVDVTRPEGKEKEIPVMVHSNAEIGDLVFLLKGCSVPVVMRRINLAEHRSDPSKWQWRIIGGAYTDVAVDPVMQLLDHWKKGSRSPEEPPRTRLLDVLIC